MSRYFIHYFYLFFKLTSLNGLQIWLHSITKDQRWGCLRIPLESAPSDRRDSSLAARLVQCTHWPRIHILATTAIATLGVWTTTVTGTTRFPSPANTSMRWVHYANGLMTYVRSRPHSRSTFEQIWKVSIRYKLLVVIIPISPISQPNLEDLLSSRKTKICWRFPRISLLLHFNSYKLNLY